MYKYLFFAVIIFLSGCLGLKSRKNNSSFLHETEYNFNFTEGTKNKLLGNKNQAILYFIRCLEIKPESSAAYYQLSQIYANNGDLLKAIQFSKRAYKLDKNNFWYILQLAQLYQNTESIDTTIQLYKQLVHIKPEVEDYRIHLAFLYFKNKKVNKAINELKTYTNYYGITENVSVALYQIYRLTNRSDFAISTLRAAVNRYPGETRFYGLLAEHFLSRNQMDSSLFYFNKLLNIDPENEKGLLSFIEYYKLNNDTSNVKKYSFLFINNPNNQITDKFDLLSEFIINSKYRQRFKTEIQDALNKLLLNFPNLERLYLLQSDFYIRNNDYKNAKLVLESVISKFNVKYPVYEQFLYVLNNLNLFQDIIHVTNPILVSFPDKPLPYLFQGIAFYNLKDYKQAINSFSNGVKYIRQSRELAIQFYTHLGECYQAIGEFDKSEFNFEKVLQYDPNNYIVLNNYSYYLAMRNSSLDKALDYINRCLVKFPESSIYLDTYGWILYKKGDILNAKSALEKAIKNGGLKNEDIVSHYCEILYYSGYKQEAQAYYNLLNKNNKSSENLKKLFIVQ